MDCYKRSTQRPFIFDPVPIDPHKPWFVNVPVGINTLNNVVSKVCKSVDVTFRNYTNHSLRATAASRMFKKGVPEKIIAERMGHLMDCVHTKGAVRSKLRQCVVQCY